MKTNKIAMAAVVSAVALAGFSASSKSFKRGVGENSFLLKTEIEPLTAGVSWFYNWGNTPNGHLADSIAAIPDADFEFEPMCWSSNYNAGNIRAYCQSHPDTKYLLGFNEPNFKSQSNMTPAAAAAAWPAVKALADELGLKLVGPAVNYSPDGPENDPYTWYAEFVKLVGTDAFDYIAIHNYSGGSAGMKEMADRFYDLYGKPIWVTEFCNWSGTVSADSQISSMVEQIEYLEKSDRIYRYAWFKAKGSITSSPCYGLLVPKNGYGERELSEAGKVYVYMTDFDETVYHSTTGLVPATEYIASHGLMLGSTGDARNPKPIEITRFNSGAYADYQFDIPSAGEYTLTLRVAGQGEPTRFDPTIAVYSVDADGNVLSTLAEKRQFQLSGDDALFAEVGFTMQLQAGKQRLRIQDENPYQPSGIRISTLSFDPNAGVTVLPEGGKMGCAVSGDDFVVSGGAARAMVADLNGRILFDGSVEDGVISAAAFPKGLYIVRLVSESGLAETVKVVK